MVGPIHSQIGVDTSSTDVSVHGSRVTSVQKRIEPQKSFSGDSVDQDRRAQCRGHRSGRLRRPPRRESRKEVECSAPLRLGRSGATLSYGDSLGLTTADGLNPCLRGCKPARSGTDGAVAAGATERPGTPHPEEAINVRPVPRPVQKMPGPGVNTLSGSKWRLALTSWPQTGWKCCCQSCLENGIALIV